MPEVACKRGGPPGKAGCCALTAPAVYLLGRRLTDARRTSSQGRFTVCTGWA